MPKQRGVVSKTADKQDKEFGSTAAKDEEAVDRMVNEGGEVPDGPDRHPRAAGKAVPASDK